MESTRNTCPAPAALLPDRYSMTEGRRRAPFFHCLMRIFQMDFDARLRAVCAACVALPTLLMLRSQPLLIAAPMFTAALLALVVTAVAARCRAAPRRGGAPINALDVALITLAMALLAQWADDRLAFAAQALQPLAALALVFLLLRALRRLGPQQLDTCAEGMAWGFVLAGGWNCVVGLVQFIELDGLLTCCMMVDVAGRASGNFLQPNHLSSFLAWAVLGAGWLALRGHVGVRSAGRLAALFGTGVGLSGSRIGLLELAALLLAAALWWWREPASDVSEKRAAIGLRVAATAFGLAVAIALLRPVVGEWLSLPQSGVIERSMASGESLRIYMWRQIWQLASVQSWSGAGWDQLGFALLDTPGLPISVRDVQNAHNLPLHLIAVVGWPVGATVTLALLYYLAAATVRVCQGAGLTAAFGAAGLLTIGIHSMVEFPLWYHHLLVPTALLAALAAPPGAATRVASEAVPARPAHAVIWMPVLSIAAIAWLHALHDYALVARAFSQDRGTASGPIDEAYKRCVWFEPPAAFAKALQMPRDAAGQQELHLVANRVLKVQVRPPFLLSEIVWLEQAGDVSRAERYARYLGSVFGARGDAGAALDSAAEQFGRPGLHRLADVAREGAHHWR